MSSTDHTTTNQPMVTAETRGQSISVFANSETFGTAQRIAGALSASNIVPEIYQNNLPNCLVALEMAQRIGMSPLMVMQNLNIIHGKPSWSSQFIIAAINNTGRFSPLRFDLSGEGKTKQCVCWAIEKATGDRLESPSVSMQMALDEGWIDRKGSKWKTMPDVMMRYRSATFFGRIYAPEVLMGMRPEDELIDIIDGTAVRDSEPPQMQSAPMPKAKVAEVAAAPAPVVATPEASKPAPAPISEADEEAATLAAFGEPGTMPPPQKPSVSTPPKVPQNGGDKVISAGGLAALRRTIAKAGLHETNVCHKFKIESIELLKISDFDAAMNFVKSEVNAK